MNYGNFEFKFYRTPQIFFGPGQKKQLPALVKRIGSPVLLLHSPHSIPDIYRQNLLKELESASIKVYTNICTGEPSPDQIDSIVNLFCDKNIRTVIAIGGGSVIDAGKAVSAMLPIKESVTDYLEVVGTKNHPGVKIPFFALPTTAGTGSEASANAVLTKTGKNGFKRSLRHENFVPDYSIVDPELMLECPEHITASCGLDAITQLLESYVSPKASILTDSLVEKALPLLGKKLISLTSFAKNDLNARTAMAYGSMISGITLANAGLGVVHGLAPAIGSLFSVPHGVVCGRLLGAATKQNIEKSSKNGLLSVQEKYSRAGFLLTGKDGDIDKGCDLLISELDQLTDKLHISKLSDYGITVNDIDCILKDSGNKNNPVELNDKEMGMIIKEGI